MTGPRQSGKTTLTRMAFPGRPYVSLRDPLGAGVRRGGPARLPRRFESGGILDEIQRAPELCPTCRASSTTTRRPVASSSRDPRPPVAQRRSQSLAGEDGAARAVAPRPGGYPSLDGSDDDLDTVIWRGSYPRIHDRGLPASGRCRLHRGLSRARRPGPARRRRSRAPTRSSGSALARRAALEPRLARRGLRRFPAHRTALALDAGSELIAFRLPPFHANLGKRLIKRRSCTSTARPRGDLLDRHARAAATHPLRGAMFEGWLVRRSSSGTGTAAAARDLVLRERDRLEIDLVIRGRRS